MCPPRLPLQLSCLPSTNLFLAESSPPVRCAVLKWLWATCSTSWWTAAPRWAADWVAGDCSTVPSWRCLLVCCLVSLTTWVYCLKTLLNCMYVLDCSTHFVQIVVVGVICLHSLSIYCTFEQFCPAASLRVKTEAMLDWCSCPLLITCCLPNPTDTSSSVYWAYSACICSRAQDMHQQPPTG